MPATDRCLATTSRRLRALLDYWCAKCCRRRLPSRRDIDPVEIPGHLPAITLFDVASPDTVAAPEPKLGNDHTGYAMTDRRRFRFRLVGTSVARLLPHDPTGRFLDEVLDDSELLVASELLNYVTDSAEPTVIPGRLAWTRRSWLPAEWLFLPLSQDEHRVDIILCCVDLPTTPLRLPPERPRLIFDWQQP